MSHQDTNTAPNQNTPIEFQVVIGYRASLLDAPADAFAISANRLGLTVPQITKELCRNGYAAGTTEVENSLNRQGVQSMSQVAPAGFNTLRWDARADAFTLAAHQIGQAPVQILAGLSTAGYGATADEVAESLNRQGVRRV